MKKSRLIVAAQIVLIVLAIYGVHGKIDSGKIVLPFSKKEP